MTVERRPVTTYLIYFSLLAIPARAWAGPEALCRPLHEILPPQPELPAQADVSRGPLQLWAERAELHEKQRLTDFFGNVVGRRLQQVVRAEQVSYNHQQDTLLATGKVTLWDPQLIVSAEKVALQGEHQGQAERAKYWLVTRRGRGSAEQVSRIGKDKVELHGSQYTTCDPSQEFWRLQARVLELDLPAEEGVARDVTVHVAGVPVLYTPYLSFPTSDKRKSGLLPPRVGISDHRGTEIELPYYWNIAPNYDATFTPHFMSNRGLGLNTEFRYLTPRSQGQWDWEFLPYDNEFGGSRSLIKVTHQTLFSPHLGTRLIYQEASDPAYFEDLGTGLELASVTHLERLAEARYAGAWFSALARLQSYQTLDRNPAARPYQRLPQLRLTSALPPRNRALNLQFSAEYNYFQRNLDATAELPNPVGSRIDVQTLASYPLRTPGWFIEPALNLQYTAYALEDQPTGLDSSPQRFTPRITTDAGLIFEREIHWNDSDWLQTLEPRLFLRYAPHRDQQDIPIFDTAETDFSMEQLFRPEFFVGPDRVGDEQRLSLALFSRTMESASGEERLRLGLGHTVYFNDPQVTLPGKALMRSEADWIGEISVDPSPAWTFAHTVHWSERNHNQPSANSGARQHLLRLRYHPEPWKALNFSYRMRDASWGEPLEQTDISWQWPLSNHWRTLGRWNYSLEQHQHLEALVGLEYESCCWAVRALARRYLRNLSGDFGSDFYIQFELKGLGRLGKKTTGMLAEQIPGFSPWASE